MRRQRYLVCTDLSVDTHTYLVRNRLTPFLEDTRRGQTDYTARQVFATCVARALAPHVGGQAEATRRVVEIPARELSRIWPAFFRPELGDVWAVSFVYNQPAGDHWEVEKVGWHFDLVGVQESGAAALTFPAALDFREVSNLSWLNLSRTIREIQARASAAGFEFREDVDHV